MADDPASRHPRARVTDLLHELQQLSLNPDWDQEWLKSVLQATTILHALLMAKGGSIGECRKATPYKPLKPVIDAGGKLIWCCEHDPEHCAS
jgi:hypothetical protein